MNYLRFIATKVNSFITPIPDRKEAVQYIRKRVAEGKPLMVARLGSVEIKTVLYEVSNPILSYMLSSYVHRHIGNNAGFFPVKKEFLKRYARLMIEDMAEVDILGSWRPEEVFFRKKLKDSWKCALRDLGPMDESGTWLSELGGKRVLVVHPFAETIKQQYRENRTRIWKNPDVLPQMASLETVRAVQTIAGNNDSRFATWFDALDYMKTEIDNHDYDICLIGCGAYGFPLAAHVKRQGKIAMHIGGGLQLLFGIKGKRWDNHGFYNEYWVFPSENERPKNLNTVENGCYW